jgi:hypothetical protein
VRWWPKSGGVQPLLSAWSTAARSGEGEAMAAAEMAAAAAAAALLRRTDIGQQYNSFERQVLVVVVAAAVVTVRGRRQGASWWRWRWRRRRRWWWRWRFHIRLTPCAASARTPCARWIAAFAPRDDHVESVERTRGMCMYPFRRRADCFISVSKLFRQYLWEGNTRIDPRCNPD